MKKTISLLLVLALILVLSVSMFAGCAAKTATPAETPATTGAAATTDTAVIPEKTVPLKVALILPGEITDMGWNAAAYNGLNSAKEKYNLEIAYSEKVSDSDAEEFFRGYAQDGYDMIIGHGFEFGAPAAKVAKDFPNTKFVITSINLTQEPNLGSITTDNSQQGFLAGATAALISKNGKIGYIGGRELPPVIEKQKNSELAAKYVKPDTQFTSVILGTYDDLQKAKESTYSLIEQGVDVIIANADKSTIAILEACNEKGVYGIGIGGVYMDKLPNVIPVDVVNNASICIENPIERLTKNEWKPDFTMLGVKDGAVKLTEWNTWVPQGVKDGVAKAIEDLNAGKVELIRVAQ